MRRPSGQIARSLLFAAAFMAAFLLAAPARATVPTTSNSITVPGNSSQTNFLFPFVGVAASDIQVLYTTSAGLQTTLVQGPGTAQYQVSLNAAVPPALWGVGGSITYNPSGTPIPSGSTLTISRVLPVQQQTSLQNQASFGQYSQVAEQALDLQNMQLQQVANSFGRAIVANAANASPPNPLPPAAQAANQGLCFDGTGNNLIACSLAPAGTISAAMAPVVAASTLASAKTQLGLGTMAAENINAGTCGGATIQDDGAGNARAIYPTAGDSTNQTVTCAFHGTQRAATASIVYTLPLTTTLFNGFGFYVYSASSAITFTPNAADSFAGLSSGQSLLVPPGTVTFVITSAAGSWIAGQSVMQMPPISNTWYNNALSAPPICGAVGLKITNGGTPNTTIALTADQLVMQDPNGRTVSRNTVSLTSIAITSGLVTSTANGMDGESPGTSAWQYIWAIDSGSTVAGLVSKATGFGGTPTMPTGYTYRCRLGAMYVDGSGNLLRTLQLGSEAQYQVTTATNTAVLPVITSSFGTFWTAQAVGTFVPPTATKIKTAVELNLAVNVFSGATGTPTAVGGVASNSSYGQPGASGRPPCGNSLNVPSGQVQGVTEILDTVCEITLESTNIYTGISATSTGTATSSASGVLSAIGWKDKVNAQ